MEKLELYKIEEKVGEGSFGQVYRARRRLDGEIVGFKVIRKQGRSLTELKNLRQEREIQRDLDHPYIIKMLDSFETNDEIVVVTEYAIGDLYKLIKECGSVPEKFAQSVAGCLVSALYYLHSMGLLHRDLKPQNILVKSDGVVKLCDFGFARTVNVESVVVRSIKGTPLYMAPEMFEHEFYDHTADLWSLGCIIYELIVGAPPFKTNSVLLLFNMIRHTEIKWPEDVSESCISFLQGLLKKNPKERLTWPHLLDHDFVKDRVVKVVGKKHKRIRRQRRNKIIEEKCTDQVSSFEGHDAVKVINSRPERENGEWIAFLRTYVKELTNGNVESLLESRLVQLCVTPLRLTGVDARVVIEVTRVLSLPFVVSKTKDALDQIEEVYLNVNIVKHLVISLQYLMAESPESLETDKTIQANTKLPSTLFRDELEALEYTMLLLCRLVHTRDKFVFQFSDNIRYVNGVVLLQRLLTLEKEKTRIVADLVAILCHMMSFHSKAPRLLKLVEQVVLFSHLPGIPLEQFLKLFNHKQAAVRARTCHLIILLAQWSHETLERIGCISLRDLVEGLLTDDDQTVKHAAELCKQQINTFHVEK